MRGIWVNGVFGRLLLKAGHFVIRLLCRIIDQMMVLLERGLAARPSPGQMHITRHTGLLPVFASVVPASDSCNSSVNNC